MACALHGPCTRSLCAAVVRMATPCGHSAQVLCAGPLGHHFVSSLSRFQPPPPPPLFRDGLSVPQPLPSAPQCPPTALQSSAQPCTRCPTASNRRRSGSWDPLSNPLSHPAQPWPFYPEGMFMFFFWFRPGQAGKAHLPNGTRESSRTQGPEQSCATIIPQLRVVADMTRRWGELPPALPCLSCGLVSATAGVGTFRT